MGHYDDIRKVMEAVRNYREAGAIPENPHEIDRLSEELLRKFNLEDAAIEWKRISKYEREVRGGTWNESD